MDENRVTSRRRQWFRLSGALCLLAALPVFGGEGDGTGTSGEKTEPPSETKKPDATDVRHVIDNLSLVRDLNKLGKPDEEKKGAGLWQQLVDQPYFTPLLRAQKLLFHGQFADAEKAFDTVLVDAKLTDPDKEAATEGRLAAILNQGHAKDRARFDAAVTALNDAARKSPPVLLLRAQAALQAGSRGDAQTVLKDFAESQAVWTAIPSPTVLAIFNLYGDVLETEANYPAASAIYERIAALALKELPDDPAVRTEVAHAIYRSGILTAVGGSQPREVLNLLTKIIEDVDRTYWPAHLEMAKLLLASHNTKDGGAEVDLTLGLNPNNFEAREFAVDSAIQSYDFDHAASALESLKALSDCAQVKALQGRLALKQRIPDQAIALLQEAIKQDPGYPDPRGWLAGAYYILAQPQKAEEQLAALKTPDGAAHPVVLFECAEVLRDARQFTLAEKLYLQAAQAAGWWSDPYAGLAQLYLETGEDAKAKDAYDRSFKIDPFNMRAYNQLTLLDFLADTKKFRVKETQHFILRYSPEDQVLAEMAAEWLETHVYPEVTAYYGVKDLAVKTKIEFYPTHEQFGVRTTGLPWIGTVGACTGNVIAMDVPRRTEEGGEGGTFDWARVLRHEFTHTVTLALTENRIPHWLTEAAACNMEEAPRDWDNCQLLCSNYRAGTLFKFEDLNWGFIRPKRTIDRQLAYMQSQWIFEYLVETYGQPKMLDFLAAFRAGKTEPQAFLETYGKSMADVNKDFLAWAGKQIESWGLPADPLPTRAVAEKAAKDDPKSVTARVTLAWVMLNGGNPADVKSAEKLLREAIVTDPKNAQARELLGAILKTEAEIAKATHKPDDAKAKLAEAQTTLEAVVKDDPRRPVSWRTLGLMAMADRQFDDAEKDFQELQQLRPLEETSYQNLAGIYLLRKNYPAAIAQLMELQQHEQKDERIPRRLAELLRSPESGGGGQLREAESMAYKAIRINPYNAINHQLMGQILMDEKVPARAVEFFQHATELQPKIAVYWVQLADAYGLAGDATNASEAAKKAEALDPETGAAAAKQWIKP